MARARRLGLLLALAVLGGVGLAPGSEAAPARPAAAPQRATPIYRMESVRATTPDWYGEDRLAFLGNRRAGEPMDLLVWSPASGQLGRLSDKPALRHSLTIAGTRIAFVERSDEPVAVESTGAKGWRGALQPQPGPEMVMLQLPGKRAFQPVFKGWVLPGTLKWSPAGDRLAFVTMDRLGNHRLAILTPGEPAKMVELSDDFEIEALLGWSSPTDVLLQVVPPGGAPQLLQVGRDGERPYPGAVAPRLAPNGHALIVKAESSTPGAWLRALDGSGRALHPAATAYAWAPDGQGVYVVAGRDMLLVDTAGKIKRTWPHVAALGVGDVWVSPNGKWLAFSQDFALAAMPLR